MLPFSLPRPSGPPKFPPTPPVPNTITMPREEYAALKAAAVRLAEEAADLRAKVLRAEEELAKLRKADRSPVERALFRRCEEAESNAAALDMRNAELREALNDRECRGQGCDCKSKQVTS
jgi:hypothetical protein